MQQVWRCEWEAVTVAAKTKLRKEAASPWLTERSCSGWLNPIRITTSLHAFESVGGLHSTKWIFGAAFIPGSIWAVKLFGSIVFTLQMLNEVMLMRLVGILFYTFFRLELIFNEAPVRPPLMLLFEPLCACGAWRHKVPLNEQGGCCEQRGRQHRPKRRSPVQPRQPIPLCSALPSYTTTSWWQSSITTPEPH